jgi:hypothetical protein
MYFRKIINSDARSTPVLRVAHLQNAIHMTPIYEVTCPFVLNT